MKGAARMQAPLPQRINAKLPRLLVVLELRRHAGRDVEDESEIEYRREETGAVLSGVGPHSCFLKVASRSDI